MKVFTTGEVAEYCGVNFRTVIRWIERGLLDAYKLPGRGDHRITKSALLAFMNENKMPVPEELAGSNAIMVIDDDEQVTRAIARALRTLDYDIVVENESFSAGAKLMMVRPKLLLLDWNMPQMSGEKILRFVRDQVQFNDLKVIVISASNKATLKLTLGMGADAYLQKPFSNQELIGAIQEVLGVALNGKLNQQIG